MIRLKIVILIQLLLKAAMFHIYLEHLWRGTHETKSGHAGLASKCTIYSKYLDFRLVPVLVWAEN